jgi:hypothetical protein
MPDNEARPTNQQLIQATLDQLQQKLRHLVDEFASGSINRTQFHSLYDRYQRQLAHFMQISSNPDDLEAIAGSEADSTVALRRRLTARVVGVSLYSNQSGMPIETLGEFSVDPALLVPMLSSYRAATREIFKAGMRGAAMENDQWLCFVPGNFTTVIALFSVEPATMQMRNLEQMHRDFEDANKVALESGQFDPAALAYPFITFVRQAHEKGTGTTGSYRVPKQD